MNADCGGAGPSIIFKRQPDVQCTSLEYSLHGGNANVILFRDNGWPYADAEDTLGLTTLWFDRHTGEIFDVDVEINTTDFTFTTGDADVGFDLLSTLQHETGHFLGLAHSPVEDATMFAMPRQGSTAGRQLSADDVAGICAVYPAGDGAPDPACEPSPQEFSPKCAKDQTTAEPAKNDDGCSIAPGAPRPMPLGGLAFALLAGVTGALRRRRRSRALRPALVAGEAALSRRRRLLARASALVVVAALRGRAHANGALPASYGILLPSDKPSVVVLATNFGMIESEDGGATWLWTCEQPQISLGYLYGLGPAPRDRLYGLSPEQGLAFSDDGSCSWQRAGGALASLVASDFFVEPAGGARVLAIAAPLDPDAGVGPPSIYESTDAGTTFAATPLYAAPAGANLVGVEISRANPLVVYAAMYTTPGRHPRLLRSADGGRSWTERDLEAAIGGNEFRILAVDRADENLLYLLVKAPGLESVTVTRDAGETFETPVAIKDGRVTTFARLESGTVLVGSETTLANGAIIAAGYRSSDGARTFEPWRLLPQPHLLGLAERGGILYLAGKNDTDGWALATSHDEGVTLTPLSIYQDVVGVKPCVQSSCGTQCRLVASLGIWTDALCTATPTPAPQSSGCHCEASPTSPGGCAAMSGAALLGLVARRRRRWRRSRCCFRHDARGDDRPPP
jgi:hypothetical protein